MLHPKLWFNEPQEKEPEPSDPLWPFYKSKDRDAWTSDACRDVTKLHYSYDDLKVPKQGGKEALEVDSLDKLCRSINEQYGSARGYGPGKRYSTTEPEDDYIVNVVYDR